MNTPLPTNLIQLQEELSSFALHHQVKGIRDADDFMLTAKTKYKNEPRDSDGTETNKAYNSGIDYGILIAFGWLKTYEAELGARLDRV